jgi:hypothetical protein
MMRVLADRLYADFACPLMLGPFLLMRELAPPAPIDEEVQ